MARKKAATTSPDPNDVWVGTVYIVRDENGGAITAAYDNLTDVDETGEVGVYTLSQVGTVQTEKTFKERD